MYVELATLDRATTEEQTREAVFAATEYHLNGVSILPTYLAETKQYVPDMVISTPIDYPIGISDLKIREHAIISALRHGANTIDLVMNYSLVVNKKMERLLLDLETCLAICKTRQAVLRVMLEYRIYEKVKIFFQVIEILQSLGIEYVFPSTGHRVDSFSDNLIVCKSIMEKSNLKVIANGGIRTPEQYESVKKAEVYGVRFTSIPVIRSIFGV